MSQPIRFDAARSWLFETALPFWSTVGVDPRGGFVEHLDLDARPVDPGFTRTRVQARQIFVFSQAALAGFTPARAAADRGYRLLTETAWLGPYGGWARRVTQDGMVCDDTRDLYDLAFVLFALAWRHRAARDPGCLDLAHQTLDFLERNMRHLSGGFLNALPAMGEPRQQNPHMHLIEAAQALYEAWPDERFSAMAHEIADLFVTRFFDMKTGTLAEFFTEDWQRAPGDFGRITEPGHQFEWGWILAHHQRLFRRTDLTEVIRRLIDVATEHGVCPDTGLTYDQVRDDGVVLSRASRWWPQTERLKAELARAEFLDDPRPAVLATTLDNVLGRYLAGVSAGTWCDQLDEHRNAAGDKIPASSLYHIALALFELLRLEPMLLMPAGA